MKIFVLLRNPFGSSIFILLVMVLLTHSTSNTWKFLFNFALLFFCVTVVGPYWWPGDDRHAIPSCIFIFISLSLSEGSLQVKTEVAFFSERGQLLLKKWFALLQSSSNLGFILEIWSNSHLQIVKKIEETFFESVTSYWFDIEWPFYKLKHLIKKVNTVYIFLCAVLMIMCQWQTLNINDPLTI